MTACRCQAFAPPLSNTKGASRKPATGARAGSSLRLPGPTGIRRRWPRTSLADWHCRWATSLPSSTPPTWRSVHTGGHGGGLYVADPLGTGAILLDLLVYGYAVDPSGGDSVAGLSGRRCDIEGSVDRGRITAESSGLTCVAPGIRRYHAPGLKVRLLPVRCLAGSPVDHPLSPRSKTSRSQLTSHGQERLLA
jgi:hypothetical protein